MTSNNQLQSPPQGSENLSITPEHIWAITGPSITAAVENELVPLLIQNKLASYEVPDIGQLQETTRNQLDEDISEVLPQEESFVRDVAGTILAAMQAKPDASEYLVMFDIDETLARRSITGSNLHVVRPSAVPLMAALQGLDSRIKFGLLTSRGQGYLDEELQNPNELASLVPYLDLTKVVSCRTEVAQPYGSKYLPEENGGGYVMGVYQKVRGCEKLLGESADRSVILVDDLPDIDRIASDDRFRTVSLRNSGGFWIDI